MIPKMPLAEQAEQCIAELKTITEEHKANLMLSAAILIRLENLERMRVGFGDNKQLESSGESEV